MKNIEIVTAQKVEISYPLATLVQRGVAFLLDLVVIFLAGLLFYFLFIWIAGDSYVMVDNLSMLFYSPFAIFYTVASETFFNGQTLGKRVLNIRVIKVTGERLEFSDYLIRWIFRVVDLWFSVGSVAIILHLSNEKRQRLGGVLSNTVVVQTQSSRNYTLSDVLNIMKLKNYEVTYNSAPVFSESQMLVVKETLERYKRFPNESHRLAVATLAKKAARTLNDGPPPKQPVKFLRTLLRDYIYLTR